MGTIVSETHTVLSVPKEAVVVMLAAGVGKILKVIRWVASAQFAPVVTKSTFHCVGTRTA